MRNEIIGTASALVQPDPEAPAWQQAVWAHYHQLQQQLPLSPDVQERMALTQTTLRAWQEPAKTWYAALFLPWREHYSDQWPDLAPPDPALAELVNAWFRLHQLTAYTGVSLSDPQRTYSLRLRGLMRAAYIMRPLVMLTLADHKARLEQTLAKPGTPTRQALWKETEQVFLPLLQMLGMWHLRRDWLERAAAELYPSAVERIIQTLVEPQRPLYREAERMIETVVRDCFPTDMAITIRPRDNAPGRVYYRQQRGETVDALAAVMTLEIITDSESNCYRLLGALHTLGKPIQARLRDLVASPGPNGYRVLHTAIICQHSDWPRLHNRALAIRIMSTAMEQLNNQGILYERSPDAQIPAWVRETIWWRQDATIARARELMQRYDVGVPPGADDQQIYVFTPQGQVLALPARSTAIDFAYQLHSDIGHHCYGVLINGQRATHASELTNGHLVQLEHNPFYAGPQSHWLSIARNNSTKGKIKRGLAAQHRIGHPGRERVERFLQSLRDDSGFVIPGPKLEKHLRDLAGELGLPSLNALYNQIKDPHNGYGLISAERVVGYLLEAELAMSVIDANGDPILSPQIPRATYGRPNLRFCANCKPVPGAPIVLQRKWQANKLHLTLHRQPAAQGQSRNLPLRYGIPRKTLERSCIGGLPSDTLDYDVAWAPVDVGYESFNVTIVANDRSGLVGELLKPIYDDDYIVLNYMQAATDGDGIATISFAVACYRMEQFAPFIQKLEDTPGTIKVEHYPLLVSETAGRRLRDGSVFSIPYTLMPVAEPQMLFGRENEIAAYRSWLVADRPEQLIVVHGQRRAGKTSLVRIAPALIGGRMRHVYVDLQILRSRVTLANICAEIIRQIDDSLQPNISPQVLAHSYVRPEPTAIAHDPVQTLRNYLEMVMQLDELNRFILCLDEFNLVLAECHDQALYDMLRTFALTLFPRLTLVLVTHSEHVLRQAGHPAADMLGRARHLEIKPLEPTAARRLIEEPTRTWLTYDPDVVTAIQLRTASHPYLINYLCQEIVQQMMHNDRARVVAHDLAEVERKLLRDGAHWFDFVTNKIGPEHRPLMRAIAAAQTEEGGHSVRLAEVAPRSGYDFHTALRHARFLANYQILELHENDASTAATVALTIPYFGQWVVQTW